MSVEKASEGCRLGGGSKGMRIEGCIERRRVIMREPGEVIR